MHISLFGGERSADSLRSLGVPARWTAVAGAEVFLLIPLISDPPNARVWFASQLLVVT